MNTSPALPTPLSPEEYQELAAFMDDVGVLDIEGVLGLLHAVSIAPSVILPSRWLPVLLSQDQSDGLNMAEMQVLLELLMRQYNQVLRGLSRGMVLMPEAHEEECCVRFAEGFVAGAELDARWRSDEWLWRFVEPIAYLAGRFDLVTQSKRAELAAKPHVQSLLCTDMEPIIANANLELREARSRNAKSAPAGPGARVGRNDACPCGSGRKYKRCCGP